MEYEMLKKQWFWMWRNIVRTLQNLISSILFLKRKFTRRQTVTSKQDWPRALQKKRNAHNDVLAK